MDEIAYRQAEERLFASIGVEPTERRIHLQQLNVDVRVQEVGDGTPVLFIHGGPNSGSTWMSLAARTHGLRCLLLDRPGTGLSQPLPDPVRPHNLVAYASTLAADVLDALDVDVAHLVVSSFGGYVGLQSAATWPERFGRMVQMACPAFVPGFRTPAFMRAIMMPGLGRLIGALPPNPTAARSIMRQIGHGASLDAGRFDDDFIDWYVALQRHTDTMANETAMISKRPQGPDLRPGPDDPDDVLARVTAPTHFLWGEDDTFGGADVARRLVATMPRASLEMVPDAGHLPWLDDPDHAATVVMTHLSAEVTS
jgi:2-hydroxy-6-oxonona-2,4-dienedioate hydrolase